MPVVLFSEARLRLLLGCPPAQRKVMYFDQAIRGLALEHRQSGRATWYFRYRAPQGRTKAMRLGAVEQTTLDQARAMALEFREAVNANLDPAAGRSRAQAPWVLRDYVLNVYLPRLRITKRGWQSDQSIFKQHVDAAFGHRLMTSLSQEEIAQWRDGRRRAGYAVSTCNQLLVFLGSLMSSCPDVEVNPVSGIKPLRGERRHDRTLKEDERLRLFAALDAYPGPSSVPDIIRLLLLTGARKREMLDARWDQLDLLQGTLRVPRAKSGAVRYIYLSNAAAGILKRQTRQPTQNYVFPSPATGQPYRSIHHSWDQIRQAAGLSDVRLHDLRHTFASLLVNAGRSLYDVQVLLGHRNPQTTMRYAHLQRETLREAVDSVGDAIQP